MNRSDVTVIGGGYVGLVTAAGLAQGGHSVLLVENDRRRLSILQQGQVPIFEAGLPEAFAAALAAGRIEVASGVGAANGIVLICVGTPIGEDGRSDLSQLRSALAELETVASPETVLVIRSTLPVSSASLLGRWTRIPTSRIFTNPEFLRQGSAMADFERPSRIVVGRYQDADPAALKAVVDLVGVPGVETIVVDVTASELIKNGANAFLALKLSFANELAALAEEIGTDIDDVLTGITADPRIGTAYLRPGFGFGGSCLPKELQTLAVAGRSVGLEMHVTTAASMANLAQQDRFATRIATILGGLQDRRIGLLGLAFKGGTDDVRSSPALRLATALLASGANLRAYDPAAIPNARRALPDLQTVDDAASVFADADAVVVATEWPEFRSLPFADLRTAMAEPLLIDGRRLLDARRLRELGYRVVVVGSGEPHVEALQI
jgi:UDPglucose 6-dehydrogenase